MGFNHLNNFLTGHALLLTWFKLSFPFDLVFFYLKYFCHSNTFLMLLSLFQVELDSLAAGVTHVEETLQRLSDEQLSGQLAVVKVGHQR